MIKCVYIKLKAFISKCVLQISIAEREVYYTKVTTWEEFRSMHNMVK